MLIRFRTSLLMLTVGISIAAQAQIRLPAVIGDHMVLQQQSDAALWGWSGPAEEITITASWDKDNTLKVKSTNGGTWKTSLKTPVAGGPYTITLKSGGQTVVVNDILIGEVWICSGQSNMEWSAQNTSEDAKSEVPKATNPQLRLFYVPRSTAGSPQERGEGQWVLCTPESMKGFSAVGYFFGKKVSSELKAPVGLISACWGGTPAETWTPAERVNDRPELKEASTHPSLSEWWPRDPGIAYNGMVRPLVPFTIAGVLWYQGESNVSAPATYKTLMAQLIEGWRSDFKKEFPFYYVQIAPYTYGTKYEGALLREQQSQLLSVPKTGMVVITDVVDNVADIHPRFKKPVGERLANYALGDTYKKPILGYQSPVYKSMEIDRNRIKISFDYAQYGLISHNGDPTQFTIAGEDRKFYPATAKIDGGVVIVSAKEVKLPVAVRFCFDNATIPNLFNKEGLPVSIFRTDHWELE